MIPTEPNQDVDLMRRIVARDQTALAELYDAYAPALYGMAVRVLGNRTLAEEATQDTFMKVWRQASEWDPERGKLISWMLTIARYTAIDRLRKEKRQSPWTAVGIDDLLYLIGRADVVDREAWANRQLLKSLFKQLPEEQTKAIELAFFEGLTHQEISDQLNEPLGTIKSRIRDGLRKLKGLWLQSTG